MDCLKSIAEIKKLFAAEEYVDVKNMNTEDGLERFLVKISSCRPGTVYFNLIRLFNLLLANRMAHHAARSVAPP